MTRTTHNPKPPGIIQIEYWPRITRKHLQNHPQVKFVYGDNAMRIGLGGQAKEMRGEPNAFGIATKFAPGREERDYFSDLEPSHMVIMQTDITKVIMHCNAFKIVLPADGIGTGLAELPQRAPRLYRTLYDVFAAISNCPWPAPDPARVML